MEKNVNFFRSDIAEKALEIAVNAPAFTSAPGDYSVNSALARAAMIYDFLLGESPYLKKEDSPVIPALIHTKAKRNRRLFDHLLSMGIIVNPVFEKGAFEAGSEAIDYMLVSADH